jgi:hypothetical protein
MSNNSEEEEMLESRLDVYDGNLYTKEQFIDYYGNTELWDSAPLLPAPIYKQEKRFDDNCDGQLPYTKKEFLDFYGEKEGEKLWENSVTYKEQFDSKQTQCSTGIEENKLEDDENYHML